MTQTLWKKTWKLFLKKIAISQDKTHIVCVCFRHNLNEESKVIMEKKPKKPNKQCPLLVTYLRDCVWELQLDRSLPCEGGNKAVHAYWDLGAISRSLNIFHYEKKSARKVFQQEHDLIKMV